jgi:hypothetical protein
LLSIKNKEIFELKKSFTINKASKLVVYLETDLIYYELIDQPAIQSNLIVVLINQQNDFI